MTQARVLKITLVVMALVAIADSAHAQGVKKYLCTRPGGGFVLAFYQKVPTAPWLMAICSNGSGADLNFGGVARAGSSDWAKLTPGGGDMQWSNNFVGYPWGYFIFNAGTLKLTFVNSVLGTDRSTYRCQQVSNVDRRYLCDPLL